MFKEKSIEVGRNVILEQSNVLKRLAERLDEGFEQAVDLIATCSGMVIVTGLGKSGHVGCKLASTFSSLGTPAFFMHATEASHGDSGAVKKDAVFIALSHSGRTEEMLQAVDIVRKLNVPIVTITNKSESPLAEMSTAVLTYDIEKESDHLGLAPTSSTTAMLALGDALAVAVSVNRCFTRQDFFKCHTGGQLGKLMDCSPGS